MLTTVLGSWFSSPKNSLRALAVRIGSEIRVLYHASRDPRTFWMVKLFVVLVIAYAISPIDLIPDFIPVIGYLDDLILVPLGLYLSFKMIPAEVLESARNKVDHPLMSSDRRLLRIGGLGMIVVLWGLLAFLLWKWANA